MLTYIPRAVASKGDKKSFVNNVLHLIFYFLFLKFNLSSEISTDVSG